MSISGLFDAIGLFTVEELVETETAKFVAVGLDFATTLFSSFLFLHPLRHLIGAAYQAGILSAASRAEMADVEQMKKIVPLNTCEIAFGQNVCELMFGVDVSDLNFRVQFNSVKQLIQSNSVGSGNMSHCGTSAFYYPLNHCLIVLKNVEHRTK